MKTSKFFILAIIIVIVAIGVMQAADLSDLYFGTVYKRFLIIRNGNNTDVLGLHATELATIYDGTLTAEAPFSLSQAAMMINSTLPLQFNNVNNFIQGAASSLLIDGNTDLQLTGTVITITGDVLPATDDTYDLGSSSYEWADLYVDGTANLDEANIGSGAITGTTISGSTGSFTTLAASSTVSFDGGTFVFNDSGADLDFRFEGDTSANLLFGDASADQIGIKTNTPSATLDIVGTLEVSSTSAFTGAITATGGVVGDITGDLAGDVTSTGTSAFGKITTSDEFTSSGNIIMSSANILMNSGNYIYFDDDDNSGIGSAANDYISFVLGGSSELTLYNTALYPTTDDGNSLGTPGNEWHDGFFDGTLHADVLDVDETAGFVGLATFTGGFNSVADSDFDDLVTFSDLIAFNGTPQTLRPEAAAAGVINATTTITEFEINGANDLTIANGATNGQKKIVVCTKETAAGAGTLTGANFAGTSVTLDAVGSGITLYWISSASVWNLAGAPNGGTYTP